MKLEDIYIGILKNETNIEYFTYLNQEKKVKAILLYKKNKKIYNLETKELYNVNEIFNNLYIKVNNLKRR